MPPSINRVVFLCGLSALTAAAEGCQRGPAWKLAPVEGTITKDGHPLRGVPVVFLPDADAGTQGPGASGFTDEAGRYRLRNHNGDDGTVVGKHRVVILDPTDAKGDKGWSKLAARRLQPKEAIPLPPNDAKRPKEQRVPPRYGRFDETPLRVEVQPGPQVIDLEVK
jgi:hypothetical protein